MAKHTTTSEDNKTEVYSTPQTMKLLEYIPEAFAGIDSEKKLEDGTSLHIFFVDDKPIVGFHGDQGTCKSSNLECIKLLLGGDEAANSLNRKEKNKKAEMHIVVPEANTRYISKVTRTGFTVTMIQDNDRGGVTRSTVNKPKDFIRNLVGPVGVSPMFLKEMDGKGQIKWIRSQSILNDEQRDLENQANKDYETKFAERTEVNRTLGFHKNDLIASGYYNFDDKQKTLVANSLFADDKKKVAEVSTDDDANNSIFESAQKKLSQYNAAKTKLDGFNLSIEHTELDIKQLEEKLISARQLLGNLQKSKSDAENWIKENENAQSEFDAAMDVINKAGDVKVIKAKIETAEKRRAEYSEAEIKKINLDAALDKIQAVKKQIVQAITPDIEGLEVVVAGMEIDNASTSEVKEEGLYWNGKSMAELSESELWDLCLQFWSRQNTRVVIIDNITSLGSDAIKRINWFAEKGGRVFYSAMERNVKELRVQYHDQLS